MPSALLVLVLLTPIDALSAVAPRNCALVFLKPHAANDVCEKFVRAALEAAGISVTASG